MTPFLNQKAPIYPFKTNQPLFSFNQRILKANQYLCPTSLTKKPSSWQITPCASIFNQRIPMWSFKANQSLPLLISVIIHPCLLTISICFSTEKHFFFFFFCIKISVVQMSPSTMSIEVFTTGKKQTVKCDLKVKGIYTTKVRKRERKFFLFIFLFFIIVTIIRLTSAA